MEYGFLSVIPSLVAILLAILTRRVLLSLLLGLWVGYWILAGGNPLEATLGTVVGLVRTFQNINNTYVLLFTLCIGALIALMQYSGGVQGFVDYIFKALQRLPARVVPTRLVQGLAALMGTVLFIESNLSILTVGTLFRPLFDRLRISREKLAYLCDSTSAPACILFPFNAWGVYIIGILALNGFEAPLSLLLHALWLNFYPILTLILLFLFLFFRFEIGAMRKAKPTSVSQETKSSTTDTDPHKVLRKGVVPQAHNMLFPLLSMVVLMPVFMVYTGWADAHTHVSFFEQVGAAFLEGDGAFSVLLSSLFALGLAVLWYKRQRLFSIKEALRKAEQGSMDMRTLATLMLLAFALGMLCKDLQTGEYLATWVKGWLSPVWLPVLFFLLGSVISFSTGTSWGTFAIVLPLLMPMTEATGASVSLSLAAILGGGIFGDHCSPISDTTLVSSLAAGCPHIAHVRTQLPYALLAGSCTVLLYILFGFFF